MHRTDLSHLFTKEITMLSADLAALADTVLGLQQRLAELEATQKHQMSHVAVVKLRALTGDTLTAWQRARTLAQEAERVNA